MPAPTAGNRPPVVSQAPQFAQQHLHLHHHHHRPHIHQQQQQQPGDASASTADTANAIAAPHHVIMQSHIGRAAPLTPAAGALADSQKIATAALRSAAAAADDDSPPSSDVEGGGDKEFHLDELLLLDRERAPTAELPQPPAAASGARPSRTRRDAAAAPREAAAKTDDDGDGNDDEDDDNEAAVGDGSTSTTIASRSGGIKSTDNSNELRTETVGQRPPPAQPQPERQLTNTTPFAARPRGQIEMSPTSSSSSLTFPPIRPASAVGAAPNRWPHRQAISSSHSTSPQPWPQPSPTRPSQHHRSVMAEMPSVRRDLRGLSAELPIDSGGDGVVGSASTGLQRY